MKKYPSLINFLTSMINFLISKLKEKTKMFSSQGSFIQNVSILAGGTALGQGIIILMTPVLTRLYTPDDFGILAVFSSILGLFTVAGSWRYELAIPLPRKDEEAVPLVILCVSIVLIMSLFVGISLLLVGDYLLHLLNASKLRPFLGLIPIGILLTGTYQVLVYWFIRTKRFSVIATTRFYQGLGTAISQIGAGVVRSGSLGLLIGQIIGQGVGLLTLGKQLPAQMKCYNKIKRSDISSILFTAKRYRRFPLLTIGPAMINSLGLQLPVLVLSSLYGTQIAGWFSFTNKIFGAPLSLISTSTSAVLLGQAAENHRKEKALEPFFWKILKQQIILGAPLLIFALISPFVFPLIFGMNWRESGIYASVWLPAMIADFITSPTGGFLDVLERQDLAVVRESLRLVIILGTIYLSERFSLHPLEFITFLSVSMILFSFVYAGLSLYAIKKVRYES
jgi:O-antigen/teichoic acid export membrane protein